MDKLTETVDFPTPPFPLAIAIIFSASILYLLSFGFLLFGEPGIFSAVKTMFADNTFGKDKTFFLRLFLSFASEV